jgi:hypothetical protein
MVVFLFHMIKAQNLNHINVMGQMWLYHTLGYVGREYAFIKNYAYY